MIVSLPEPIDTDHLAERVRGRRGRSEFQVMVQPVLPVKRLSPDGQFDRFVVTAFGKDQPGIVRRFSQYLAGKDINIVDLYGDRRGRIRAHRPGGSAARWDIRMMQTDLEQMGHELGFTVKLQHENIFVATNQLRLLIPRAGAVGRADRKC